MSTLISAAAVQTAAGRLGDAVLIDNDLVVAVGRRSELGAEAKAEYRYEDGVILPGLRDSHFHPVGYTAALNGTTLGGIVDLAEMRDVLGAAAARIVPGAALIATRFDDAVVAERRLPTRADLDRATGSTPTLVHRYCGHVAIANTAALAAAGIDATTADPHGGVIDRDDDGVPTGVLRETAIDLVSPHLNAAVKPTPQDVVEAMTLLAGIGLTSIGAMLGLGDGPWASFGDEVATLAAAADDLPIRLHVYVIAHSTDDLHEARRRIERAGPRLRWAGVKIFADGSLGGHTAAMDAPFADAPGETGTLRLTPDDLELASASLQAGGMVAIHAIGDRANTTVLDHYETIIQRGASPERLRLEHASVLNPADVERIGQMGIVASVQPAFLGSEVDWLEERVGSDRLPFTYPFRSLQRAGATLAGGSDCPVESPNPFAGMALAIDRAGIVVEEGLDPAAALGLFTQATALQEPAPLAAGSPADLIVVDRNPVEVTPDELRETQVLGTFVDGAEIEVDRTRPYWVE